MNGAQMASLLEVGFMATTLSEDNAIARSMGLTYGVYKAKLYAKGISLESPESAKKKEKKSNRRFTDAEAFSLWQAGKNDCEIGAALGVSRQIIQRWRDTMELPSTAKYDIDTKKYQMIKTPVGMFVICIDDL